MLNTYAPSSGSAACAAVTPPSFCFTSPSAAASPRTSCTTPLTPMPAVRGNSPYACTRYGFVRLSNTSHLIDESEISMPAAAGVMSCGTGNQREIASDDERTILENEGVRRETCIRQLYPAATK